MYFQPSLHRQQLSTQMKAVGALGPLPPASRQAGQAARQKGLVESAQTLKRGSDAAKMRMTVAAEPIPLTQHPNSIWREPGSEQARGEDLARSIFVTTRVAPTVTVRSPSTHRAWYRNTVTVTAGGLGSGVKVKTRAESRP